MVMEQANKEAVLKQIGEEIKANKVLLYVKGTKTAPQCGFSAATIGLFNHLGKPFETIDVLANPDRRQFVPEYSQWPTFPQIFVNGEFIGGCDIIHELQEKGELQAILDKAFAE